jgi:transposase-like protein
MRWGAVLVVLPRLIFCHVEILTSSPKLVPAAVRESFRAAGPERFSQMSQKRHSVDQIIAKLRRADVLLGKDTKVPEICKQLEIAEQTYYRWRQKYGGMQPEMAKQLKTLEKENARLKKMVAEQALDMDILMEAAKGNW